MSSVVIAGDSSGQITLAAPAVAGTTTITAPAVSGTMVVLPTTPSMVRLNTDNGNGSTNTAIRRYTTTVTNQGSDITYADSATLGASFTINTSGIYAVSMGFATGTAGAQFGVSLDSTQLTTSFPSISISSQLCEATVSASGYVSTAATTLYLPSGSVLRPHTVVSATSVGNSMFTIVRVA